MKRKQRNNISIDGVGQRQRRRQLGDFNDVQKISGDSFTAANNDISKAAENAKQESQNVEVEVITQEDIIESTRSEVDSSKIGAKGWRSRRKAKKLAKKQKLAKKHVVYRTFRRTLKFAVIFVLLIGGYVALSSWSALNNIIDRDGDGALALQDNILPSQLKGEGDGRINIMLLGIGGDQHEGGDLADSILIASIDRFANEMALLSVPRDMLVTVPEYGQQKVNAAHATGQEIDREGNYGIDLTQQVLEETLDINIHYYARVDFQGFSQAIDTVGGVTVNLEEAVYDNNFDWQFGTDALRLDAGYNTLDGQTALLLARARGAGTASYGLAGSDFSRTENQRRILVALKDKILSLGTFANPVRLTQLIENAGSHARTNISIGEMLTLNEIVNEIPASSVVSVGLDDYLGGESISGLGSVLLPKSGDFTEIQLFVRQVFIDGFIKSEQPKVDVFNGTVVAGLAGDTAKELESYGYTIGEVNNANEQNYGDSIGYDLADGKKPYTKALLSKRFGVSMKPGSQLPEEFQGTDADFVIIIGDKYVQQETSF